MSSLILFTLYWLIVISIVLVIIGENRNPLKALPWILVVLFLPVVGIVLYIFFGEDLRRIRIIDARLFSRISGIPFHIQKHMLAPSGRDLYDTPIRKLLKCVGNSSILPYDHITIYTAGRDKFADLLEDLNRATHHIHLEYYALCDDRIGTAIAEVLKRQAAKGIRVRVIYDDVGSWKTKKKFWKELWQAGVEAYPFMKVFFPLLSSRVNYRNHRKLAVIDGKVGYVGGMNIGDRYYYGDSLGQWRDTHFRITGPAVSLLQSTFVLDWHTVTQRIISPKGYYPLVDKESLQVNETALMQLVAGKPTGKWRTIEQALTRLILEANETIDIETPYFLPTDVLRNALINAALSGVRVRLLIPDQSDVPTVQLAAESYISELLDAGIEVFRYTAGFLHSKITLIDNKIAVGGSANLDFRSLEHNFELVALFYDESTTQRLVEVFEEDLEKSARIDPSTWEDRPRLKRFMQSTMRLFSPLM